MDAQARTLRAWAKLTPARFHGVRGATTIALRRSRPSSVLLGNTAVGRQPKTRRNRPYVPRLPTRRHHLRGFRTLPRCLPPRISAKHALGRLSGTCPRGQQCRTQLFQRENAIELERQAEAASRGSGKVENKNTSDDRLNEPLEHSQGAVGACRRRPFVRHQYGVVLDDHTGRVPVCVLDSVGLTRSVYAASLGVQRLISYNQVTKSNAAV